MGEYERYRRRRLFGDLFFKPGNWCLMFSHVCDGQVEIIQNESKERMVYHERSIKSNYQTGRYCCVAC